MIRDLQLEFDQGLTIITGETGAGKSILLGALGLILGERADTKVLYDTQSKCVVRAVFDIKRYNLGDFFQQHDLDYEDELHIHRELTPSGKSRAFVNDTPVRLNLLQKLSGALIDLHRQFDTLDINNMSFQLRLLDALAGQQDQVKTYRKAYQTYLSKLNELKQLEQRQKQDSFERDHLRYYLEEISEAQIKPGEQEELEQLEKRLVHAEEIGQRLYTTHYQLLESDKAVLDSIQELLYELGKWQEQLPALKNYVHRMEELLIEMKELTAELPELSKEVEANPDELESVRQRLDQLYRLQKKHQLTSADELLQKQREIEGKLREESDLLQRIDDLKREVKEREEALHKLAATISKARQKAAPPFQKRVVKMLHQLAMPSAQLDIHFSPTEELTPSGTDQVEFLFSANKGMPLQAIKQVASGGELARLALTTKSLVASAIPLPTLIFDEIDTGISGDVARKMGHILAELAERHQVICITHSPQVAARAGKHYEVFKRESKDSTQTGVALLQDDQRIHALAVMLSQNPPSEAAIANAKELLEGQ